MTAKTVGNVIYIVGNPIDAFAIASVAEGYDVVIVEDESQIPAGKGNYVRKPRRSPRPPRRSGGNV